MAHRRPGIIYGSGPRKNAIVKCRWATQIVQSRAAQPGDSYYINTVGFSRPSNVDQHQPLYHDTWKALYTRYRVLGVKYRITFRTLSGTTTANIPIVCYAYPHRQTFGLIPANGMTTDLYIRFLEQGPGIRSLKLGMICETDKSKTWRDKCTLRGFVNNRRLIGAWQDEGWESHFDALPANYFYLNYGFSDTTGTNRTDSIMIIIRLTYIVRLLEPKRQSLDDAYA